MHCLHPHPRVTLSQHSCCHLFCSVVRFLELIEHWSFCTNLKPLCGYELGQRPLGAVLSWRADRSRTSWLPSAYGRPASCYCHKPCALESTEKVTRFVGKCDVSCLCAGPSSTAAISRRPSEGEPAAKRMRGPSPMLPSSGHANGAGNGHSGSQAAAAGGGSSGAGAAPAGQGLGPDSLSRAGNCAAAAAAMPRPPAKPLVVPKCGDSVRCAL